MSKLKASELLSQAVADLDCEHETSMSLWLAYWNARNALRNVAIKRSWGVHKKYYQDGLDAWVPSEGFKEIANDDTEQMRTVRGDD